MFAGAGVGGEGSALYKESLPGFLFSKTAEADLRPTGKDPSWHPCHPARRLLAAEDATRWDVGDPDDGHLMEHKAPPRKTKQGGGQHE